METLNVNEKTDVYAAPKASLSTSTKVSFFKTRTGSMLTLLVITMVCFVLMSSPFKNLGLETASRFIATISMYVCIIWWLELDAKIYEFNTSKRFRIFLVVLTPIVFIYYSYKTRGWLKGTFLIILSFVIIVLISLIGSITLDIINLIYAQ